MSDPDDPRNRSRRVNLRLTPATETRWKMAASARDYRYLSTFVEDAVEAFIQGDSHLRNVPQGALGVAGAGNGLTDLSPTVSAADCPRASSHRVGSFCKGCNRVITKEIVHAED